MKLAEKMQISRERRGLVAYVAYTRRRRRRQRPIKISDQRKLEVPKQPGEFDHASLLPYARTHVHAKRVMSRVCFYKSMSFITWSPCAHMEVLLFKKLFSNVI